MAADQSTGDAATAPASKGKGKSIGVLVVVLLMAVEAVGIFMLAKAIRRAPAAVEAAELDTEAEGEASENLDAFAEVELAECRPSNMMTGKFITFHIRVSALVAKEDSERATALARAKQARLEDGVNTVIRSAEPKQLSEPQLNTIRRRLKHEFDEILGDDRLIKKVLIPQLLQSGSGV